MGRAGGRAPNKTAQRADTRFSALFGSRRGLSATQLREDAAAQACARWFEAVPANADDGASADSEPDVTPLECLVKEILGQEKLSTSEIQRLRDAAAARAGDSITVGQIDRAVVYELAHLLAARHHPDARAAHMRRALGPDDWWSAAHQIFPQAEEPTTRACSPLQHLSAERYEQMWREGLTFHGCRPPRKELLPRPDRVAAELTSYRQFLGNALVSALTGE